MEGIVNVIETTSFLPFRQTARTMSCAVVMARTRFRHVTLHINIFYQLLLWLFWFSSERDGKVVHQNLEESNVQSAGVKSTWVSDSSSTYAEMFKKVTRCADTLSSALTGLTWLDNLFQDAPQRADQVLRVGLEISFIRHTIHSSRG